MRWADWVIWALNWTAGVQRRQSLRTKLWFNQLIFIPTHTYGHMFWVITRRMRPNSWVSFVGWPEMLVWTFDGDWGSWSASGIQLKCLFDIFFRSWEATWGRARTCCRCHIYLIWPANVSGPLRNNWKVGRGITPSGTSCSAKKKKRYGWTNRWLYRCAFKISENRDKHQTTSFLCQQWHLLNWIYPTNRTKCRYSFELYTTD